MAFGAPELPLTFTVSGRLFDAPTSAEPLLDSNIDFRVQILDSTKDCVLYDERRFISTATSDGAYAVQVGAGTRISGSDPGNSMEVVFQNLAAVPATCVSAAVSAPPVIGSGRYLRIMIRPSGASSYEVLSPEVFMGPTPSALVAETLGGLSKDQFIRISPTQNLNQANLESLFSGTNFSTLTDVLAGNTPSTGGSSPTNYVLSAGSGAIRFMTSSTLRAEVTNAGDFVVGQRIGIGTGAVAPSTDLAFGGSADRMIGVERNPTADAAGKKLIIEAGGATATSTDQEGGDLYLSSGTATGSGSSKIFFETATPGASGSADRNPSTKMVLDGNGSLGVGVLAPTAKLHLAAGSTQENSAPLKFTSGPLLTTPEDGVMEFLTNTLYFTSGGVRHQIPFSNAGEISSVTGISNVAGNISITPQTGGSVTMTGAFSTSSSSGALIVNGGVGVSQNLNVAGNVYSATGYMPQIYGSATSAGNIRIDGADNATKGNVLLASPGGNVGVGTAAPLYALDVHKQDGVGAVVDVARFYANAASTATSRILFGSFGSATPTAAVGARTNTATQSDLIFYTNNSGLAERMRISSDGNLGIGTSAPTDKLSLQSDLSDNYITFRGTSRQGVRFIRGSTHGHTFTADSNGDLRIAQANDLNEHYVRFLNGTRNTFFNGQVAIGTTAVTSQFNVNSNGTPFDFQRNGLSGQIGSFKKAYTATLNEDPYLNFNHQMTDGGPFDRYGFIQGGGNLNGLRVQGVDASGAYGKLVLNSYGGNVGIGTATPVKKFVVQDEVPVEVQLINNNNNSNQTANSEIAKLDFNPRFNGASGSEVARISSYYQGNGTTRSGDLRFSTSNSSSAVEQMRISPAGNVGIGLTTPAHKLHVETGAVSGTSVIYGRDTNATGGSHSAVHGHTIDSGLAVGVYGDIAGFDGTRWFGISGRSATPSSPAVIGVNSGVNGVAGYFLGNVGIGIESPAYPLDVVGTVRAGDYLFTSDGRLKTEIKPLTSPLSAAKKLRGVSFTWKKDGQQAIGFIAQEVEKIFPQLVRTDDRGMKSVQYGNISAIILEAMKEYFASNDADKEALRKRLQVSEAHGRALEEKLKEQAARTEAIERRLQALERAPSSKPAR